MSLLILGYKKTGFQLGNSLVLTISIFLSLSLSDHQLSCYENTQAIYKEVHIVKLTRNHMGELRGRLSEAYQELHN